MTRFPCRQVSRMAIGSVPTTLGRDLLARTLTGGRVSLTLGASRDAGRPGHRCDLRCNRRAMSAGLVDSLMMRFVDVFYAVPFIFLVILLTFLFGRSLVSLLIAIGAVYWLTIAVIVRGETLSLKRKEFIEAARAGGMGTTAIILRHIVPNTVAPVIVYASMTVSDVILGESLLSFLGLGVQEPNTSWGVLIDQGAGSMESNVVGARVPRHLSGSHAVRPQLHCRWSARCLRPKEPLKRNPAQKRGRCWRCRG